MTKLMKNVSVALGLGVLFVGFQNCSGNHSGDITSYQGPSTVDVGQLQAAATGVMSERCAKCHNPTTNATFETPSGIENIMDIDALLFNAYIIPGEPQSSPLYIAVVDGIMPHGEEEDLNEFELEIIRDWIVALGDDSIDADVIPPSDAPDDDNPPTFAQVQTIINARCVGCHRVGGRKEDAPLQTQAQIMAFVDSPGNANGSRLYQEVRGSNPTMPEPPNAPLTSGQVDTIRRWINSLDDEMP